MAVTEGTTSPADQPDVELAANLPDRPDGPGAAATLASGVAIFVLGLLTVLSEANTAIHDFLADFQAGRGVGPLAGKTTIAGVVFFVAGGAFGFAWWKRDVDFQRVFWISLALGILGAIGTFPPFFELFE